jgi:hypothetical protein
MIMSYELLNIDSVVIWAGIKYVIVLTTVNNFVHFDMLQLVIVCYVIHEEEF